jgi:hypothetical protein
MRRGAHSGAPFQESIGIRSDRASATLGEPALTKTTSVILCVAAPHSGFLVGLQSVLQAIFTNHAGVADGHSGLDLLDRGTCGSYREEERGL